MEPIEHGFFINTPTAQMFKGERPTYVSASGLVRNGRRAYLQSVAVARTRRSAAQAARPRVLIIAADGIARQIYGELFALRGYHVVTATGARDGLRAAHDRRIGVVVLALATGVAQLRRRLHALRPMVRVHVTGMVAPLPLDAGSAAERSLH